MRNLLRIAFALTASTFILSCGNKSNKDINNNDSIMSDSIVTDSTIYGVTTEFGMSTFALVTDKGDTLYLNRDNEKGEYGVIYGDAEYDKKFAVTTRDNNQTLAVAINLSQLSEYKLDYSIYNCHLIIKGDTTNIESLDSDSLVVTSSKGEKIVFKK